jgi:hypothetical protein
MPYPPIVDYISSQQILEKDPLQPNGPPQTSLVEIGPRFVLTPIRIFEGAFGGAVVYSNPGLYTSQIPVLAHELIPL